MRCFYKWNFWRKKKKVFLNCVCIWELIVLYVWKFLNIGYVYEIKSNKWYLSDLFVICEERYFWRRLLIFWFWGEKLFKLNGDIGLVIIFVLMLLCKLIINIL